MRIRSLRPVSAVALAALTLGLLVIAGGAGTAAVAPTDGLSNGGFSTSRAGWAATPATAAKLSLTAKGRVGRGLLVRKTSTRAVVVRAVRPVAMAGGAGRQYRLTGWVRASRTGQQVTAIVREYRGTRLLRAAKSAVALTAGAWTPVRTTLTRAAADTTFRVRFRIGTGQPSDWSILDRVSLVRLPAPSSASAPGCFTSRGVPQCGPLLGSAYGANTDPASFESSIGNKLAVRRTYWTASQVDSAVKVATGDLAHGRIPWISFKLPYSWSAMAAGSGDAWAKGLAAKLAALPGPVWIAFHHEPEGDGDITQWTAMQAHLAPLVRAAAPNVAYTIILTGWNQLYGATQYHLDSLWPKNTKVDIAGFDVYNALGVVKNGVMNTKGTNLASSYFAPISAWAKAHGVAWGLGETGYTDYASQLQPHWIQQTYAAMKTYGGVAFAYFNTTLNSVAPWHLGTAVKVADYRAAQAQSPTWR